MVVEQRDQFVVLRPLNTAVVDTVAIEGKSKHRKKAPKLLEFFVGKPSHAAYQDIPLHEPKKLRYHFHRCVPQMK